MGTTPTVRIRHLRTLEAAPLILAQRRGLFAHHGIEVDLRPVDGWSMAKNLLISGGIDAAHMPLPMPLACAMGIDGRQTDLRLALQLSPACGGLIVGPGLNNANDPSAFVGKRIGVPHRYSLSHYLLAHWLADAGVNPLRDVEIVEVAPSRMRSSLRDGRVEAVFAQPPFAQQIIHEGEGALVLRIVDIWKHLPGDVLAVRQSFHEERPEVHRALVAAVADGVRSLRDVTEERAALLASELAPMIHQIDEHVIARALMEMPHRLPAAPLAEHVIWTVAQMQRWGQLIGQRDHREFASTVCLTDEAKEILGEARETGFPRTFSVLGDEFDPAQVEQEIGRLPFSVYDPNEEPTQHLYQQPEAIFKRLDLIIDAMAEVGAGQLDLRLPVTSTGSVGLLEQAFNEMVSNLQVFREELHELRETLEGRVEERTGELLEANELLERLLHEDVLTGLYNRRHLTETLSKEVKRARRHSVSLSAVMVDLDHFKVVNDTHGHQVGDVVLAIIGEVMRDCARETDIMARYGGEEFCAILPHTPQEGAAQFAERLRAAIEARVITLEEGELSVTASLGVATLSQEMEGAEALLRAADEALYQAKETGRNRVCAAG